jgi:hypothetical protein
LALSRLDVGEGPQSRQTSPGNIVVEEKRAHSATPRPENSGQQAAIQSSTETDAPSAALPAGESGPGAVAQHGAGMDAL